MSLTATMISEMRDAPVEVVEVNLDGRKRKAEPGEIRACTRLEVLSVFVLVAVTVACTPDKPGNDQSLVESREPCFVAPPDGMTLDNDMDCGYVVVPQNRAEPDGVEIRLAYQRIHATTDTDRAPLFMLSGGPGKSAIESQKLLLLQDELLGGILENRDVVLLEQRGARYSQPYLDCPEQSRVAYETLRLDPDERPEDPGAGVLANCIARHQAAGVDFSSFNNVENAADVDAAREALGYDKIVFYGVSYGTLLGQHVMRDFPEALESVVLDGTDALSDKSWIEYRAIDAQTGLDNLTAACRQQPECASQYDIPRLVADALALFDEGPVPVELPDPEDATRTVRFDVDVGTFVAMLYEMQTGRYALAALPLTLQQLVDGGREQVAEMLGQIELQQVLMSKAMPDTGMATLMHAAMVCSDDPVKSADDIRLDGVTEFPKIFARAAADQYIGLCELIDVKTLPDTVDVNVQSDLPVLILSGGLDVQTPVFLSQKVADGLPNSTHAVFPSGFHGQVGNINRCALAIMTAFVNDPSETPDLKCTSEGQPILFVMPEDLADDAASATP